MGGRDCLVCNGDRWVQVGAGYAQRRIPDPSAAQLESLAPDVQAAMWATVEARRQWAARSVVPCKVCRPELFLRWSGGHLDSGHESAGCETCSGATRPVRRPDPSWDRRDLE